MDPTTDSTAGGYSALALNYFTGLANISLANRQASVGQQSTAPAQNANAVANQLSSNAAKFGIIAVVLLVGVLIVKKMI